MLVTKTMRMQLLRTAFLAVAMVLSVVLHAGKAMATGSDTLRLADDAKRKYEFFFHEANRQNLLGNYDATVELLTYCLDLNPNSDAALYELSKFQSYLGSDSCAEQYLKRAVELAPDNYWYSNALVGLYVKESKIEDAISVVEELSKKYPKKTDVLLMLVDLYTRNDDFANVIKTLDRLEIKEGKSEQLSMQKFRMYVQMKDEKRAYQEIVSLSEEYPNDLRYRVLLGDLYLDNGEADKALEIYRDVERIDSSNINVMLSLAEYYSKQKQDSLYQQQIEKIVLNPNLNPDMKLQIMTGVVYNNIANKGDTAKVMRMFDRVLATPQENAAMTELCVRYLVSVSAPTSQIKPVLHKMLAIEPEHDTARNQLLSYAVQENDTAAIKQVCLPAVAYSAADPLYYYYLGIVYFQQKQYEEAVQTLSKGLERVQEDTPIDLISNSYTLLGDLYHDLGDDEKAYAAYDSCLIYNPEDVGALNNYAYYLSLNNHDLERAEEMSAKTIEAEPDNHTYIDTYAWILFMQKRYDEAKVQIDRALEVMGDTIEAEDSNIVEHAGDIYFKAGDKEGALRLWIKADQLGNTEAPDTLRRKIKTKKYIKK